MSEYSTYVEAFVESDGYRWRVLETDLGLVQIENQEWDHERHAWVSRRDTDILFPVEVADALCAAIQAVKAGSK